MINRFSKKNIVVVIMGVLLLTILPSHALVVGKVNLKEQSMEVNSYTETLWTNTEIISIESTEDSYAPFLAMDASGNVHITWSDYTDYAGAGTDWDIFYKFWNSTSQTWNTTEVVSTESTANPYISSLAVDVSGNVHIAWEDNTDYAGAGTDRDIFYKFWNSTSQTWNTTEVVSTESTGGSYHPSLAVDASGNVHIAWYDYTNYGGSGGDHDIFYKFWESTSQTWNVTEVVSTESTSDSYTPSLAVDATGTVYIAWYDYTNYGGSGTDRDIFYKFWNSTSQTWNTTEVVSTESTSDSYTPSLAVDVSGNVHIAWYDSTDYGGSGGDYDIFYKFWESTSQTWNVTEVVSTESIDDSFTPSLSIDTSENVHIAWSDYTNYLSCGTDCDIFYKFWDSTSQTWNVTEVVSTESTEDVTEERCSLTVDTRGNVHIAWEDYTDYVEAGTDLDIFYKKFVPLAAPTVENISPNPSSTGDITLNWNDVVNAEKYYVYRALTSISSVEGLTSIDTVTVSTYEDLSLPNGTYYYVVVASNAYLNATSNEVWVEVAIPQVTEFSSISLIITLGLVSSILVVTIIIRRKKQK